MKKDLTRPGTGMRRLEKSPANTSTPHNMDFQLRRANLITFIGSPPESFLIKAGRAAEQIYHVLDNISNKEELRRIFTELHLSQTGYSLNGKDRSIIMNEVVEKLLQYRNEPFIQMPLLISELAKLVGRRKNVDLSFRTLTKDVEAHVTRLPPKN